METALEGLLHVSTMLFWLPSSQQTSPCAVHLYPRKGQNTWFAGGTKGEGMDLPHIAGQTDVVSLQYRHHNRAALQSVPYLAGIE